MAGVGSTEGLPSRRRRRRAWAIAASAACLVLLAAIWAVSSVPPADEGPVLGFADDSAGTDGAGQFGTTPPDPSLLGLVTVPDVCSGEGGRLVSTARGGMGVRASWEVEGDVDEVAEVVLEGYRDGGEVSLGHADYLDLFGRVWGCVVSSPQGWSEVAIADGRDAVDGKGCTLTVVRLGEVAVREAAAGGEGEP